jgi:hypothetical protein
VLGVLFAIGLWPNVNVRLIRGRMKPGMTVAQALETAGNWAFCSAYQERGGETVNRIGISRYGLTLPGQREQETITPAAIPSRLEAEMKKQPGPWTVSFGYVIAPRRAYFAVNLDDQLRVASVSPMWAGLD